MMFKEAPNHFLRFVGGFLNSSTVPETELPADCRLRHGICRRTRGWRINFPALSIRLAAGLSSPDYRVLTKARRHVMPSTPVNWYKPKGRDYYNVEARGPSVYQPHLMPLAEPDHEPLFG